MADIGPGLTTEITEDEKKEGYLPVIGELHYEEGCQFARNGQKVVELPNGRQARAYVLKRECQCDRKLSEKEEYHQEEYHFSTQCRWRRIKDQGYDLQGVKKVYIYRKCYCKPRHD